MWTLPRTGSCSTRSWSSARSRDLPGQTVFTAEEAKEVAANELGYPVLVRPSYVLGGQGMQIAINDEDIDEFIGIINRIAQDHPILVDKYLMGKEIEVDAVCDGDGYPDPGYHGAYRAYRYPLRRQYLRISGQEHHREEQEDHRGIYGEAGQVPPCNRTDQHPVHCVTAKMCMSSRSIPRSCQNRAVYQQGNGYPDRAAGDQGDHAAIRSGNWAIRRDCRRRQITIAIKMPVFSFEKIRGADISLGPEMKSTGECLGIAKTFNEALYKAFLGAGIKLPKYKNMIMTVRDADKEEAVEIGRAVRRHWATGSSPPRERQTLL